MTHFVATLVGKENRLIMLPIEGTKFFQTTGNSNEGTTVFCADGESYAVQESIQLLASALKAPPTTGR